MNDSASVMHEKGADEVEASRAPLAEHLSELRSRLMRVIAAIALCSIAAFMFSEHMIDFLMVPFARAKEAFGQENLIDGVFFDSAFEILFIKLRLSIMVGLAIAFPYVAWEIYAFVAPGLYQNERRAMLPYMIATPFLFAAGGALVGKRAATHLVGSRRLSRGGAGEEEAEGGGAECVDEKWVFDAVMGVGDGEEGGEESDESEQV